MEMGTLMGIHSSHQSARNHFHTNSTFTQTVTVTLKFDVMYKQAIIFNAHLTTFYTLTGMYIAQELTSFRSRSWSVAEQALDQGQLDQALKCPGRGTYNGQAVKIFIVCSH